MLRVIILSLFFLLSAKPVAAISQFTTDYQISYRVKPSGKTHVKYQISQTNNLSRVYATEFSLSVSHTDIENLKVKDFASQIDPDVVVTNNTTSINFPFKNKIVGKNKTHEFSIEYDTGDIATKTGSVWEVNIPKMITKESVNNLSISLQVPPDFPEPVFIDPQPSQVSDNLYTFSSYALANKPISILFGSQQFFKLRASFYLKNELGSTAQKTIALPPNTSYQEVFIESINPQPENITVDPDGNWLAVYNLKPKQELEISLEQIIKLQFTPKPENGKPDLSRYLSSTKVWDYKSPKFEQVNLGGIKDPQQIFNFVTSSLIYNYALINKDPLSRQPASFSLDHPTQAICTNFTDLFIALSRKHNIPAREIQGFAMSQNDKLKPLSLSKDVLHAWPEYFDRESNTWIQVDPTWSNTTNGVDYFNKLDLNHITFVIHGQDTTTPLPAGFYKNPNRDSKDLQIKETDPIQFPQAQIQVKLIEQKGNTLIARVSNSSGSALRTTLKTLEPNITTKTTSLYLPPLSYTDLKLELKSRPITGQANTTITININNSQYTLPVVINPLLPPRAILIILISLLVLVVLIIKKIKKNNSVFPVSIKT